MFKINFQLLNEIHDVSRLRGLETRQQGEEQAGL